MFYILLQGIMENGFSLSLSGTVCELALQAFVPVLQNHNLETICKD